MQAFFSSFSSNLPCFVENQKMLGNGGFKPFSGTFPCALSLVLFPYELEKYPYFHFTTRYIFVGFAAMAWAALLPFVQCMENRDLFSGPVVALVQ